MTPAAPAVGFVSDDLTGGLLVASYFEEAGLACPVILGAEAAAAEPPRAPLAVVATRARLAPVAQALEETGRAFDALEAAGCAAFGYKVCGTFDCTEEGNIGPVADRLADRFGAPLLIQPGYTEFGLTVHWGHMFYRGVLLSESDKRFDPVTPMPDPNLARFLSRSTRAPVPLLSHFEMAGGEAAARAALAARAAEGARLVMLDASDDGDVATAVRLAAGARAMVGSDSFIIAFGLARAAGREGEAPPPRPVDGPAALFVGSVGPVAEGQLAEFEAAGHPVLRLDLLAEAGEAATVAAALDWAEARLGDRPFAVTTLADAAGVKRAQAALGVLGAARKAERLLAGVAAGVHARGARRILVGGGETSGAIAQALSVPRLRAMPRGPQGGGFCAAEGTAPLSLYLKSGKMGAPDAFLRALEAMKP